MSDKVNIVMGLICPHGDWDNISKDAEIMWKVSCHNHISINYLISGLSIDAIVGLRGDIYRHLGGHDLVRDIQGTDFFINPRYGDNDAHKSEIGVMSYNHIPTVHPFQQNSWNCYFDLMLRYQLLASKRSAEEKFWKTPVTVHPPDGVYAPDASRLIRELDFDTVIVSSEFLGMDSKARGKLYWGGGVRHLMRTNERQPHCSLSWDAKRFVDDIEEYAHVNNIPFVVMTCDIEEFYCDLGERLVEIGKEVFRRNGKVQMINANAATYWLQEADDRNEEITTKWPWYDVHAQIDEGGLEWIDQARNSKVGRVISLLAQRYKEGMDITEAREHLCQAADIANRNKHFCYDERRTAYYNGHIREALRILDNDLN